MKPDDALRVWQERGVLRPTVNWSEMMHEEHAAAFTVAKIAQLDLLSQVRESLDRVLRDGGTFEQWKADILPNLQRAGWWGVVQNRDLTGTDDSIVVNDRRLRTIYRTNLRMSISAGRWRKYQREKDLFPYLRYLSDHYRKHPRLDHKALHGVILPIDHPAWQWMFPPNGWGCNCRVEQVSEARMRRNGWVVSDRADALATPPTTEFVRADGTAVAVPTYVQPGFGYNPGTAHLQVLAERMTASIERALANGLDDAAAASLRSIVDDPAFEQFLALPQPRFPLAIMPEADASLIGARTRVAVLSDSDALKQRVRSEQGDTFRALPSTYRSIVDIVRDFTIRGREGDNTMLYAMMREDGRYLCVVVQRTASGQGLFIKSVRVQASRTIDRLFSDAVDIVDRRN
ncbi:MAG: hypothetical protein IT472_08760 [Thermomonas sp.]|uniref:phage head morphogenesis protein n=1 Tax=Thermomonas sp. TaxID=1971895 RepID=UPI002603576E|nr:phage minor head protein [Thermomonas sp.]MCC7097255.1 hypothetical protein [Thermomonas sp.]